MATVTPAVHIGTTAFTVSPPFPMTTPAGMAAGDYALITVFYQGASASVANGAGGWTKDVTFWTNYGYSMATFRKVLASGDLGGGAGGLAITGDPYGDVYVMSVYRGPTAATLKAINPGVSGSTLALAGFSKSILSQGLYSVVGDRDAYAPYAAPAGWNSRGSWGADYFGARAADLLVPASYTNGSPVSWDNIQAGYDAVGALYEFT